jgi:uncharacterized protein YndB with AHSA1/START domain
MSEVTFEIDRDALEVRISRVFNATPERMWQAHTQPDQIVQWWDKTTIDTFEPKVGGTWRFVSNDGDGKEHAFRGVFQELDEPKKIVRTFEYEPFAGHIIVETVIFEPTADGKTKQLAVSKYANLDDLNSMVGMGMEHGATEGLERLAKVVEQA